MYFGGNFGAGGAAGGRWRENRSEGTELGCCCHDKVSRRRQSNSGFSNTHLDTLIRHSNYFFQITGLGNNLLSRFPSKLSTVVGANEDINANTSHLYQRQRKHQRFHRCQTPTRMPPTSIASNANASHLHRRQNQSITANASTVDGATKHKIITKQLSAMRVE